MSIPSLCQACYKHYRSTVVTACPFCDDVQFPEQVLCDLVQEGQSEKQPFRCTAFRPALSVLHHDETEASPVEEGSEDTVNMSPKDKWFRAYAVQQLSLNPDLIAFTIRNHVVFNTRQRANVFSSEHGGPMADLVRQAVLPFEQTTVQVLWLTSDHLLALGMRRKQTRRLAAAPAPCCPRGGDASGPSWPQPPSNMAKYRLKCLYTSLVQRVF